jgi:hypothetical protein
MIYGIRVSNRREQESETKSQDVVEARKAFHAAKESLPSGYCVALYCQSETGAAATLERFVAN